MTNSDFTLAHRFATAFNTRDVDQVLDCFTPDVSYRDLYYGEAAGHGQARRLFERIYTEGHNHKWTMTCVAENPDWTIGEWTFTFTVSDAVPQRAGRTLRYHGVSVFETRQGRCHTYREHFDRAATLLALGIRPGAVARIVLRRPSVEVISAAPSTLCR